MVVAKPHILCDTFWGHLVGMLGVVLLLEARLALLTSWYNNGVMFLKASVMVKEYSKKYQQNKFIRVQFRL
ncbi:hypothetical protein TI04_02170 [Achromatium sp. WMS2]|nr:hypothetical protein TI04_02170 [Achromatium sp. WMS2]